MVHIQNATLAGGVAMGSSADFACGPAYALLVGSVAGLVSTLGYQYLQEMIVDNLGIHDTCGINNLHGMPGILGALFSVVIGNLVVVPNFSTTLQLAALGITLATSLIGGYVTGMVIDNMPG